MIEGKRRTNRTPTEIKGDFITKRFHNNELIALLGLNEFERFWDQIKETLRERDRVVASTFNTLHKLEQCEVEDVFIRDVSQTIPDIDFGNVTISGELRKYECKTHGVQSGKFVRRYGRDGDVY